jgi:hypothetical protein
MEEFTKTSGPHPPFGPDVALSDIYPFSYLQDQLGKREYHDKKELLGTVSEILFQIHSDKLREAFIERTRRLEPALQIHSHYLS